MLEACGIWNAYGKSHLVDKYLRRSILDAPPLPSVVVLYALSVSFNPFRLWTYWKSSSDPGLTLFSAFKDWALLTK